MSTIVFFDLETTGLSTVYSRIVEIAAVKQLPDGKREAFASLINPEQDIPEAATAIHHITNADVKDAPTFKTIAPQLMEFIGNHDLGGHNLLRYDIPLLQSELRRAGFPLIEMRNRRCFDTLMLFRHFEPHTLAKAIEFYVPPVKQNKLTLHRALADATASLDVFLGQQSKYNQLQSLDEASRLSGHVPRKSNDGAAKRLHSDKCEK